LAIEVPPEEVPFAVPIEARAGYVGPRFMRYLAEEVGGKFVEDPHDIGLMEDFTVLRGRWLDPAKVHPLIAEFYEHTTRFTLSVVPHWNRWYRPLFWLFRRLIAHQIGQFNLPFDERDEKRGMEMHIDTVDIDDDDVVDLRAWVRTYAGTDETIYCGVYTTVRVDGLGYVSVGFPLPDANLTATLIPANIESDGFILRTRAPEARVAGDYFVFADEETKRLSVVRIRGLREEIHVFVRDDQLLTDHRFYFGRANFLTLHYSMRRRDTPVTEPGTAAELLVKATSTVKAQGNPVSL